MNKSEASPLEAAATDSSGCARGLSVCRLRKWRQLKCISGFFKGFFLFSSLCCHDAKKSEA
ncbi:hypothetical protein HanXRQr2_Chr02g0072701 [Helianthus annuus]|uniref:Uncharacterized protein n=1 Tax=Helianthus annuus TaxID=4232 RepID=A0A251TNS7_HELAN|nr:hypothetical protein HanXRQr2_Chr02g0072701 [Helianthus annuus]